MHIHFAPLFLLLFVHLACSLPDDGTCSVDVATSADDKTYSDSWNKFLQDFNDAQANHHSCMQKDDKLNCHYAKVIQDDLNQFDEIT